MAQIFSKNNIIFPYIPGLIILIIGLVTIHSAVRLSDTHAIQESRFIFLSNQNATATGIDNAQEMKKIKSLNAEIKRRQNWLYWAVILTSLTAFMLLVLNADKYRKLSHLNAERQKSLKLLQNRLAAIEASVEGIGIVDKYGNLTYMNKALMQIHGIKPEKHDQFINKSWLELYSKDGQDILTKKVIPQFEQDGFWQDKSAVMRHDGKLIQAELSLTALEDGGFIGTARDITDQEKAAQQRKDMESQLAQAQKMEAIGRLAGGIAHDFNNILAAMMGYAEFLTEDLEKDPKLQTFAIKITQAGEQARALVDKILTFSRHKENIITHFDLRDPINESLDMLKATLPKSIDLTADLGEMQASIHGDSSQIAQMIMNLCVNAADAMDSGAGSLKISLSPVNITKDIPIENLTKSLPEPEDMPSLRMEESASGQTKLYLGHLARNRNYIRLTVCDTGCGMNREIMQHIFEPFFTTKDIHKGTGLGLATVHGVIRAHRGALIIDSTTGQDDCNGTKFEIFFPLNIIQTSIENKPIPIIENKGDAHILLVEDQEEVREMVKTMLERSGYDVKTSENGLKALDTIREHPDAFDIVITDQNMPKMNGLDLVNETHIDFPDLPFILISGYSREQLQSLMQDHPAIKAIIKKPITQKTLNHNIALILNGEEGDKVAVG